MSFLLKGIQRRVIRHHLLTRCERCYIKPNGDESNLSAPDSATVAREMTGISKK